MRFATVGLLELELVSLVTMRKLVPAVTPESGLVQGEHQMTLTRVETRPSTVQITAINT